VNQSAPRVHQIKLGQMCLRCLKLNRGEVPERLNAAVLLNLPALFVLTTFHIFLNNLARCQFTESSHLQARVHQNSLPSRIQIQPKFRL